MIFLLYIGTSALIIYISESRHQRNIVHLDVLITPGMGSKRSNHSAVRLGKSLGQYPTWYLSVLNLPPCDHLLQVRARSKILCLIWQMRKKPPNCIYLKKYERGSNTRRLILILHRLWSPLNAVWSKIVVSRVADRRRRHCWPRRWGLARFQIFQYISRDSIGTAN